MDWKEALKIVSRQAPCPHYSINTNIGDGKTWARCEDCGSTIPQEGIDRARKSAERFEEAIDLLRKIAQEQ